VVEEGATAQRGRGRAGRRGRGSGRGRWRGRGRAGEDAAEIHGDVLKDATAKDARGTDKVVVDGAMERPKRNGADLSLARLREWTADKFTEFCVLCGTDYREMDVHIKLFGIKTAFRLLARFNSAERMLKWMSRDQRWTSRFPCMFEEYAQRFRSVVAVFWHHIVFDPRRAECVSIAKSFPDSDRLLPGIDLVSLCGVPASKQHASRCAKGELDPRTLEPRTQEPLTPSERRTVEMLISQKRADQRRYKFEQQLQADAAAHAATRAAQATQGTHGSRATPAVPAPSPTPATREGHSAGDPGGVGEDIDGDGEEPPRAPREMCLLPGDIGAIIALHDEVFEERGSASQAHGAAVTVAGAGAPSAPVGVDSAGSDSAETQETPPRVSGLAAGSSDGFTPPANPFARKRLAGQASAFDSAGQAKRLRELGARESTASFSHVGGTIEHSQAHASSSAASASTGARLGGSQQGATHASATLDESGQSSDNDFARQWVEPKYHPRGGGAAEDAALAVLAQKGMPQLAPVPEDKDRGKLTSFFKRPNTEKRIEDPLKSGNATGARRSLASWRSRPWEAKHQEEEKPFAVVGNPLSIRTKPPPYRYWLTR